MIVNGTKDPLASIAFKSLEILRDAGEELSSRNELVDSPSA